MVKVGLANIVKKYQEIKAVDDISLDVKDGEIITFLGPSGCGKTTTLRIVAGLTAADSGDIYFDDELVNELPAEKRGCGMVFQNYALFPHMTVSDNIGYGLKVRKHPQKEIAEKILDVAQLMRISELLHRYPKQLSGGQQQRVAVARALAIDPKVLLMDEPLSNLDAKLREQVRVEIRDLQKKTGITTIYVTHDQEESMVISDRIAIMERGKVLQLATPQEIYQNPQTHFVADFIGKNNFISGAMQKSDQAENSIEIVIKDGTTLYAPFDPEFTPGEKVLLCVRPQYIQAVKGTIGTFEERFENVLAGQVNHVIFLGEETRYDILLNTGDNFSIYDSTSRERLKVGDKVRIGWRKTDSHIVRA